MLRRQLLTGSGVGIGTVYIMALLFVAVFFLSACSSNQQVSSVVEPNSAPDGAIEDEGVYDEYDDYMYTLDDVASLQGIYVLSSSQDSFKPIYTTDEVAINLGYDEEEFDYYYDHERAVHLYEFGEPVIVDRANGEQLVIAGQSDSSAFSIDSSNYLRKVTYSGYYQGTGVAGDIDDYEEIGGERTDSESFNISNYGIEMHRISGTDKVRNMMTSPTELHVDAGWYKGSSWVDGAINLDTPYYIVYQERDSIEPTVEPTKNGYFTIDISNLEKGIYVFQSYYLDGDMHYLFEIV